MKVLTTNPTMSLNTYFINQSINNFFFSSLPSFWILFPCGEEHPWTKSKQKRWMNEWMKKWYHKDYKKKKDPKKEPKIAGKGKVPKLGDKQKVDERTPSFPHSFPFPPPLDVIIFHIPLLVRFLFYFILSNHHHTCCRPTLYTLW